MEYNGIMLRLLQEVNIGVDDQNPQFLILVKHICSSALQLLSVPRPGSYMAGDSLSTSSPLGCFHLLSITGQIHTCTPIRVHTVAMEILWRAVCGCRMQSRASLILSKTSSCPLTDSFQHLIPTPRAPESLSNF